MGLLHRLSQWLDSYINKERLEKEECEYECQLEYVKGYLGAKPKEALQGILAREQQYHYVLQRIQLLAAACIGREPVYVNSILRQIKNMCDTPTNPQEKSELTP